MAKETTENKGLTETQGISNAMRYHFYKRWLTLQESAYYTAQSEALVKKAVYRGELVVIQRGARSKMIFDIVDLDAWMLKDKGCHKGPIDERMRAKNGRFK